MEGQIRAVELAEYLDNLKATKVVWLSEDATAIVSKVVYDPTTNQLIGIVLPHDNTSGCPIPFTFIATDAEAIKQHLMEERANNLYLVMAQPLDERIPPFLVQLFGSCNKFDTSDITRIHRIRTKKVFFSPNENYFIKFVLSPIKPRFFYPGME